MENKILVDFEIGWSDKLILVIGGGGGSTNFSSPPFHLLNGVALSGRYSVGPGPCPVCECYPLSFSTISTIRRARNYDHQVFARPPGISETHRGHSNLGDTSWALDHLWD